MQLTKAHGALDSDARSASGELFLLSSAYISVPASHCHMHAGAEGIIRRSRQEGISGQSHSSKDEEPRHRRDPGH
jgi:hypothetical protein